MMKRVTLTGPDPEVTIPTFRDFVKANLLDGDDEGMIEFSHASTFLDAMQELFDDYTTGASDEP